MVCQICGKKSGFYPLCKEHYNMVKTQEVIKCEMCGRWHLQAEGCPDCSDEPLKDRDAISFHRELPEGWSKRLFAIAKKGEKWAGTKQDNRRYRKILDISGEIHSLWSETDESRITIPIKNLEQWGINLSSIAKEGLNYSDDSYDIERYSDTLEVAEDISQQIKPHLSISDIVTSTPESAGDVRFIADREIAPALVGMIEKADGQILIATPWIWGIDDILEKISDLKRERSIRIKILLRRPEEGKEKRHREELRRLHKREFFVETVDYLHAKMILVDNKELYIGSANLVKTSFDRNREAGICTSNPSVVQDALVYFEEAFNEAFEKRV